MAATPRKPRTAGSSAISRRTTSLMYLSNSVGKDLPKDPPKLFHYVRYTGGKTPDYHVQNVNGEDRHLSFPQVPPYVVGANDAYQAVLSQLDEAVQAALVNPDVTDHPGLVQAIKKEVQARCGLPIDRATALFEDELADPHSAPRPQDDAVA